MNKLEQRFADAFENRGSTAKQMREINAKITAQICLEVAEEAYDKGYESGKDIAENGIYAMFYSFNDFKDKLL